MPPSNSSQPPDNTAGTHLPEACDPEKTSEQHPAVRSYVRREGRLTRAQSQALSSLWPQFGVEYTEQALDLDVLFGRRAPRCLDIGFGNGETLLWLAAQYPHIDYLGVEVHRPGVGRVLHEIQQQGLANIRLVCHDAIKVLRHQLPAQSLAQTLLLFPDPWPKKRHHKRRIVQPPFLQLVASRLSPGGRLHIATDWAEYGEHIAQVIERQSRLQPTDDERELPGPAARPSTKFERRGQALGHRIQDFFLRRDPSS